MALTEKNKNTLNFVQKFFPTGTFSAKDLTIASGVKISGNTLSSIAKSGYLKRHDTSPVTYTYITDNEQEAFSKMAGIFNKEDMNNWPLFNNFTYKDKFSKLGTIIPNQANESIKWVPINNTIDSYTGIVYAFIIDGHFYKAGKTDTTMKERISSYNCGKTEYRSSGTCSVTNYKILHTILNINKEVEVYGILIPKAKLTLFGETVEISCSGAKYAESKVLEQTIKDFGQKLPGCVQD